MNVLFFVGRVISEPYVSEGENPICKFKLIRNEYMGKDENDEPKSREVVAEFVVFGKSIDQIKKNFLVGDQIIVRATIRNNHYVDKHGQEHHELSLIYLSHEFGAPGKIRKTGQDDANKSMEDSRQNFTVDPNDPDLI